MNARQYPRQLLLIALSTLWCAACTDSTVHQIAQRDLPQNFGNLDGFVPSDASVTYDDTTCAIAERPVGLLPLDMLIALDTSFSMDFDGKWTSVKGAIKVFAADPTFTGLGVGMQYFPLRRQCRVSEYASPAVPIGSLPGVQAQLSTSLDEQRMFGGTPMVPMLQGALIYASAWAGDHPERKAVIIIATDGIPDDSCLSPAEPEDLPNSLDNVVQLAAEGLAAEPSISTFVIGVGNELTALNEIAQAGGTLRAILVDTARDIERAFLDALNEIRRQALPCDLEIPDPPEGEVIKFDRVNVIFTTGQATETFVRVDSADACGQAVNAWHYDDPQVPTKIVLCPDTCDRVQSAQEQGQLAVQFGCDTIVQ